MGRAVSDRRTRDEHMRDRSVPSLFSDSPNRGPKGPPLIQETSSARSGGHRGTHPE